MKISKLFIKIENKCHKTRLHVTVSENLYLKNNLYEILNFVHLSRKKLHLQKNSNCGLIAIDFK